MPFCRVYGARVLAAGRDGPFRVLEQRRCFVGGCVRGCISTPPIEQSERSRTSLSSSHHQRWCSWSWGWSWSRLSGRSGPKPTSPPGFALRGSESELGHARPLGTPPLGRRIRAVLDRPRRFRGGPRRGARPGRGGGTPPRGARDDVAAPVPEGHGVRGARPRPCGVAAPPGSGPGSRSIPPGLPAAAQALARIPHSDLPLWQEPSWP